MASTNVSTVSFLGGPYDGCVRTVAQPSLCGEIEMPVSRNVLRILAGEMAGEEQRVRMVAGYRLMFTRRGLRYCFCRFRRVRFEEATALTAWHHAMLSTWRRIVEQHGRQ